MSIDKDDRIEVEELDEEQDQSKDYLDEDEDEDDGDDEAGAEESGFADDAEDEEGQERPKGKSGNKGKARDDEDDEEESAADDDSGDEDGDEDGQAEEPSGKGSKSKIDKELRRMARDYGMDEETINEFPSSRALERVLLGMKRTSDRSSGSREGKADQAKPAGDGKQEDKPKSKRFDLTIPQELEDALDPEFMKNFKGMNDHYGSQMDELSGKLDRVYQYLQRQEQDGAIRDFDRAVVPLAKDFPEILGKGPTGRLKAGSKELENRDEVWKEVNRRIQQFREAGQRVPSYEELVKRAFRVVFYDDVMARESKAARDELRKGLKARRGVMAGRPSGRQGRTRAKGEEAGADFAEKWYRDHGITTDDYGEDGEFV
jgi:hypothetical protein